MKNVFSIFIIGAGMFATAPSYAAARWVCLAQDREYSYDAEAPSKVAAQRAALTECRAQSAEPRACYSHRCKGMAIPRGDGGTSLTWEQREYMRQRLLEQERRGYDRGSDYSGNGLRP